MPALFQMPPVDPPVEEQDSFTDNLMTYEQAAKYLKLSRARIGGLVMEELLHAVKLPGTRYRYLRREELDWYDRRRKGSAEPNPVLLGDIKRAESPQEKSPESTGKTSIQGGDAQLSRGGLQAAEPADLAISVLLWALAGSVAGAEQLGQMDAWLGDHIRALRAQPGGKEMLADLASRIAGVLARDEGTLPDTERMRVAELLTLLTTSTLQSEATTKNGVAMPSKR
jgi:excisionase family DNA binding protein